MQCIHQITSENSRGEGLSVDIRVLHVNTKIQPYNGIMAQLYKLVDDIQSKICNTELDFNKFLSKVLYSAAYFLLIRIDFSWEDYMLGSFVFPTLISHLNTIILSGFI